jgi:hypothetical protein
MDVSTQTGFGSPFTIIRISSIREMEPEPMKWVLFFLSLLALFFANNALFWVPGHYDRFAFVAAGTAISLAVIFAWLSSKRFVMPTSAAQPAWKNVVMAPPAVICLFVLLLFLAAGLLKVMAYANR